MGSLVGMALSFRFKGLGLIPDAAKDSPSACGLYARKIRGSKSPMVGR